MSLKSESRILGIDDASFDRNADTQVPVIGTLMRAGTVEGFLHGTVGVDGDDATDTLISMITSSRFARIARCIMLDGIALGGFNVIDIERLSEETGIPLIVIMRRMPDLEGVKEALTKMGTPERYELIQKAGQIHKVRGIYIQYHGLTREEAEQIIDMTQTESYLPEPLRISHMVGAALLKGESKGSNA